MFLVGHNYSLLVILGHIPSIVSKLKSLSFDSHFFCACLKEWFEFNLIKFSLFCDTIAPPAIDFIAGLPTMQEVTVRLSLILLVICPLLSKFANASRA